MDDSSWHPFDNGSTIGQPGSERGVTIRDDEHSHGARITLERDTQSAPFAITCGLYGWMVHTRFFTTESEADMQYESMKVSLSALLEVAQQSLRDDSWKPLMDGIDEFVETYP